ncbi:MAG: branched-chain amino acid ABC transporter permease, partial [Burkholderiales bacterium PBB5]
GAVLMVIALVLLSELTKAWLLYLGLVFLLMVMYAPGGLASLIMMNVRVAAFGKLKRLIPSYIVLGSTGLLGLAGLAAMIEMMYHLQLNAALGPTMKFLGVALDAGTAGSWLGAIGLLVVGGGLFEWRRRGFARDWGAIQSEIEQMIQQREARA